MCSDVKHKNFTDWVFTEAAFYLRMTDDTLIMYSPEGDHVRIFDDKVLSLHQGMGGLLIGVRRPWLPLSNDTVDTLVTDGVMNVVDTLPGVDVLQAFPNGLAGRRGDDFFISIGNQSFPCDASTIENGSLHIVEHCAISVRGTVDKTLNYFDTNDPDFVVLKTFKASPMAIPYVQVIAGPKNLFAVSAVLGDFIKIYVYGKKTLLLETTVTNSPYKTHCFTHDLFLVFHDSAVSYTCTVYPLDDFEASWTTEHKSSFEVISPQPCSYLKNSLVAFSYQHTNQIRSNSSHRKLHFCQIDLVLRSIIWKEDIDMMHDPLESSRGCYCSYFYAIERENGVSDVHLYHFHI